MSEIITLEIKVTGRVQGVGFRFFTQNKAIYLDIRGWVKNTPDNAVLIHAQGEKEKIEVFIDFLKMGPALAKVSSIEKTKLDIQADFSNFSLKF